MVKKFFSIILSLLVAVMAAPTALASNYILIIAHDDVSAEQETVIFSEHNVVPGFSKDYKVRIDNRAGVTARVVLDKIEKILPSNDNLAEAMKLKITYNGTEIAAGKYHEEQFTNQEIVCVAAETKDYLRWNLSLPVTAGNEYQGDSFELRISFKIDKKECNSESSETTSTPNTPDTDTPDSSSKTLPKTGQSQVFLNFLYGVIGISSAATLIFGGLVFFAFLRRRKNEKEESREEKSQFESIRKKSKKRKAKP